MDKLSSEFKLPLKMRLKTDWPGDFGHVNIAELDCSMGNELIAQRAVHTNKSTRFRVMQLSYINPVFK